MKNKLKKFFVEKKELLIFLLVLVLTFATVITIVEVALNQNDKPAVVDPNPDPEDPIITPDPEDPKPVVYLFNTPVSGSYVIVREYFDLSNPETFVSGVIYNGITFEGSQGVSYAKEDNSIFDVLTVYPGTVTDVEEDGLEGFVVTIAHSNDVVSKYYSLSSVNVQKGSVLSANQVIGKAGTSINDAEAGVHVHLEIYSNGEIINPHAATGKQTSEIVSSEK